MSLMAIDARAPRTPPRGKALPAPTVSAVPPPKPAATTGEVAEEYAPTLIKRLKEHVLPRAKDRRMGSVLGIMHFEGILSEVEVEAGFAYAADVAAYERMKGHPPRESQSPSFEFGRKGDTSLDLEALERMDPDTAEKLKKRIARRNKTIQKRYDRAQSYIPLFPILISTVVEQVCCNNQPVHSLHHPVVKKILRNMAERCYGLVRLSEREAERKKPTSRKMDASIVASATVDALESWFSARRGKITEFRLDRAGITCHGIVLMTGEIIAHTVNLRRSNLMVEAIRAQLLKIAEAKGWEEAAPQQDRREA